MAPVWGEDRSIVLMMFFENINVCAKKKIGFEGPQAHLRAHKIVDIPTSRDSLDPSLLTLQILTSCLALKSAARKDVGVMVQCMKFIYQSLNIEC